MTDPLMAKIERGVFGHAWHGPAWAELLADVTEEQAAAQTSIGKHSIGEIVLHVAIWMELAKQAIDGHPMPTGFAGKGDWIPMTDWPQAKTRFEKAARELIVRSPDPEETVPGRHYDFEHLLDGIAQHNAYHGGQVRLLKNAFGHS
ncbi:MAG: DinB family protein [Bryobacteraceae bacterium]|nr:DinB family protein [Bryobacteraceae bacterium]